jgi:MbtH protein
MGWDEEEDTTTYRVLISEDSKAYAMLPDNQRSPVGWKNAGFRGQKVECLKYVQNVWADVRSLSLPEVEVQVRL